MIAATLLKVICNTLIQLAPFISTGHVKRVQSVIFIRVFILSNLKGPHVVLWFGIMHIHSALFLLFSISAKNKYSLIVKKREQVTVTAQHSANCACCLYAVNFEGKKM